MKVLLLHPDLRHLGGIENYYLKVPKYFKEEVIQFVLGRRWGEQGRWQMIVRFFRDYYRFVRMLKKEQIDLVVANPSMDPKGIIREGLFLFIAKLYHRKTILFIRGWYQAFGKKVEKYGLWLFRSVFNRIDAFILLSSATEKRLHRWGITRPMYREVTVIDNTALNGFDFEQTLRTRAASEKWRVLFLARVLVQKGIFETVEALRLLRKKYPNIELVFAGDGEDLQKIQKYVKGQQIPNVTFTGYLRGLEKYRAFREAHVYILPSYTEGMPNSMIEAMAFGLPVVTRPVGGIPDLFTNGENGFMTESKEPVILANLLEKLYLDQPLWEKISRENYIYSQENFLASRAVERLERIFREVMAR